MSMWKVIFIVIVIIIAVSIYNDGWDGLKSNPLQSVLDSGNTIIDTGTGAIGFVTGENNTELVEIGMIPCTNNEDCIQVEGCINKNCSCFDNGICYGG